MHHDDTDSFLIFCRSLRRNDPGIDAVLIDYDSEAMVEHLCESLAENTVVHTFMVTLSVMKQDGMVALADLLKRNAKLKTLEIDCLLKATVDIENIRLPIFAEAFANCHLQKIKLVNGYMGIHYDDFISKFCNSLVHNTTVRTLDLYDMDIQDKNALLNTDGLRRKIMKQTNDVPVGLWAHIFAFRGGRCIDVLFYFVKSKPELFKL